jgi:hypothetical protein
MKKFWDIEFDNENPFLDVEFLDSLEKLGFEKKSQMVYVKEVVNQYGDVVKDGLLFDLTNGKLIYFAEPNCSVEMRVQDPDITLVDQFLRKNII